MSTTLPRAAHQPKGATGSVRQAGYMPRDEITLPAHKIPVSCLCTWVTSGSGEMMRLKFTHGQCQHDDGSVSWDYAAWMR